MAWWPWLQYLALVSMSFGKILNTHLLLMLGHQLVNEESMVGGKSLAYFLHRLPHWECGRVGRSLSYLTFGERWGSP